MLFLFLISLLQFTFLLSLLLFLFSLSTSLPPGRKLSQLVSLELSQEETIFVWNYLDSVCSSVEHQELLVLALVKWGYLQEAAALNDHIQSDLLVGDVQKRANDRRVVIEGLVSCEPEVVRDVWNSEMPVVKEGEIAH